MKFVKLTNVFGGHVWFGAGMIIDTPIAGESPKARARITYAGATRFVEETPETVVAAFEKQET